MWLLHSRCDSGRTQKTHTQSACAKSHRQHHTGGLAWVVAFGVRRHTCLYRLYIGSISASLTTCRLRGHGRAGTQNNRCGESFPTAPSACPLHAHAHVYTRVCTHVRVSAHARVYTHVCPASGVMVCWQVVMPSTKTKESLLDASPADSGALTQPV